MLGRARAHPLARSVQARVLMLVPTAVATLLTSRLIIDHFGLEVFNGYALVAAAMALLPMNSLGAGAAVTNAFAAFGPRSTHAELVVLTAARTLFASMALLIVASSVITAMGWWPAIVGPEVASGAAFGLALVVWSFGFVPGLGSSILLGVNRNHTILIVTGLTAPVALAGLVVVLVLGIADSAVLVLPALAIVVVNLLLARQSAKVTGFRWGTLLARVPSRGVRGESIRSMAGPAFILSLIVPLTMQGDRLVLSHFSTEEALASYSLVWQIFAPLGALLAAGAQPLWPMFEKQRSDGTPAPSLRRTVQLFGAAGVLLGGVLIVAAGPLGHLVGGNDIDLGVALPLAIAAFVVLQAASLPLAMAMMEPQGLRFAARCACIALPLNLALSIALAREYGALGPCSRPF